MNLSPEHLAELKASGIGPRARTARGYRTVDKAEARRLGFTGVQARSGLLVPLYGRDGEPVLAQLKADKPHVGRDGRSWKYVTPPGARIRIDMPPLALKKIRNRSEPLWVTEGVKKSDAAASKGLACVALTGVWCWRDKDGPLPDWKAIPLRGRDVYVAFDSDVMVNPKVRTALEALSAFLGKRGAHVQHVTLPPAPDGGKVGLDDYLKTHTVQELQGLIGSRDKLGRILSRNDLAALPKPEPLIDGMLSLRSYVLMIGEGNTNKTFTALGFACSCATGFDWLDHKVMTGPVPVIYVVGEGAYGIDDRMSAWEEAAGVTVPPHMLTVLMKPDSLTDEDFWPQLTALAVRRKARLVVFDTFSSLAPDADEVKDAPVITRRLSDLAANIDGTTLLLHHTGWGPKDRARGGSQFEHNADEVLVLQCAEENNSHVVSLKRKKVKDGPDGDVMWLRRVSVGTSCVLEATEQPEGAGERAGARRAVKDKASLRNVLMTLQSGEMGYEELRSKCAGAQGQKTEHIKVGIEKGFIALKKRGRVNYHRLTDRGRDHLGITEDGAVIVR